MNKKDFENIDYLAELAQNQKLWARHFGKFTFADVIKAKFGKDVNTIQYGEVGNVFSGVYGSYSNRIRAGRKPATKAAHVSTTGTRVIIRHHPNQADEKVVVLNRKRVNA